MHHRTQDVTIDTSITRIVIKYASNVSDDKVSVANTIDPNMIQRITIVNNRVQIINLQSTADHTMVMAQIAATPGMRTTA